MNAFWDGFEKRAAGWGMLAQGVRKINQVGKSIATKGLDMATNPAGNKLTQGVGNALHSTGNFIRKNPKGVGLGAAGLTAAGTTYAAAKAFGGGQGPQQPNPAR